MKLKAGNLLLSLLIISLIAQAITAQIVKSGAAKPLASASDASRLAKLEILLENLRQELKIPALSSAVVKDQKVIWAKGFGFADLENKIPATENTAYHLASLTKTFASTIVMQLVQEGKIKLDDPVSKYGITLESEGVIRVKHLLSHTSEGVPGEAYRYNGNRFAELDKVIQKATGKSFAELLITNILDPLGMDETAPNVPPIVHTKSPAGTDAAAETEVKNAVMNLFSGYNSGNVEQIERFLAPQQNNFPIEGSFLTSFVNAAELREAIKAGFKLNFQVYNLEAAVFGNTALTTSIIRGTIARPNAPLRNHGPSRMSIVWNKQNGGWKLVHAHESLLTEGIVLENHQQRFEKVSKTIAQPYALDNQSNINKITYPTHFSTSAGLISTVLDMAKYDIAIDRNRFLSKETQALAFTPFVSTKGEPLPYGLGWFTQNYKGMKMLWHYGYWQANSSFILKIPEKNITFIAMANTDNLSRPTDLGSGDALTSPVGMAFLKTFIFPEQFGEILPEINWKAPNEELKTQVKQTFGKSYADIYNKELNTRVRINQSIGQRNESSRLMKIYGELFLKGLPDDLAGKTALAQIVSVPDDADKTVEFSLNQSGSVRIFAAGEGDNGQMYDYGWIESAETGKPVWEMKSSETTHAGGAPKNRKVDVVIALPAGKYRLRYKSDDSHSFDNWNAMPPDINFWGIALYAKEN
ncbi:MAG TPA: serine hydrolase [Pyrinomonadaceae bacterium]|jgi:CubicO group peptidase (beta-lactamase class C family)